MFNEKEISELRNALPEKGKLFISEKTNVSLSTVYKFFNGKYVSDKLSKQIWVAGWKIVKQAQKKKEKLIQLKS